MRRRIIILGSVRPAWVAAGAIIDEDFYNNRRMAPPVHKRTRRHPIASDQWVTTRAGLLVQKTATALSISDAGLLIEGARTNNLSQSGAMTNAAWTLSNATSALSTTAPDGTSQWGLFTEDGTNNAHAFFGGSSTFSQVNGQTYAVSVFDKPGTRRYVSLRGENNGNDIPWITFDTTNNTINANANVAASGAIPLAGGVYRIWLSWLATASKASNVVVAGSDVSTAPIVSSALGNSYAGTSNFFAWGMQAELGAIPTSYIPTTTASVTRAANAVTIQRTGIGRVVFTFDDDSQQTVSGINTATQYTISDQPQSAANQALDRICVLTGQRKQPIASHKVDATRSHEPSDTGSQTTRTLKAIFRHTSRHETANR
jgi:hypothetical protein